MHIGESHRGYLGTGSVDFPALFRALAAARYQGPLTFESFSSAVVSPSLSSALCVWRNLCALPHGRSEPAVLPLRSFSGAVRPSHQQLLLYARRSLSAHLQGCSVASSWRSQDLGTHSVCVCAGGRTLRTWRARRGRMWM